MMKCILRFIFIACIFLPMCLCAKPAGEEHNKLSLKDPTKPSVQSESGLKGGDLVVQAILLDKEEKGRRAAVVNGKIVGMGDLIDGATVIAIDRQKVTFKRHDSVFEVPVVADPKRKVGGLARIEGLKD